MNLRYNCENDVAVIELGGRVHLYEIHNLRDKFDEMKDLSLNKVIIDLSDVEHIDSSGLGVLIAQASKYKDKKIPFLLTGVNRSIEHLFRLTSFSQLFTRLPTIQDAQKY